MHPRYPAASLGKQDGAGLHDGPDRVRGFQQRARFRPQLAAIFPERALEQRDDRLGFIRARRANQERVALRRLFPHLGVLPSQGAILSSSELADQRRKRLLGLGITFLAALFISLVTTFARIAYESGSNPATQVFLRSLCMMLVMGGLQLALGRSLMLPRRTILTTIVFGLCILVMSFGYLSSVFYISVSLAVLLLYTYPLIVGIASPLLGRERMTWLKALCLIGAFAGLVVASWDGFGALDWRGIAFALAAAGSISVIALFGGAAMSRAHPFVMNAWMNVWVVLAVGLYLMATAGRAFSADDGRLAGDSRGQRLLHARHPFPVPGPDADLAGPVGAHHEPGAAVLDHRRDSAAARSGRASAMDRHGHALDFLGGFDARRNDASRKKLNFLTLLIHSRPQHLQDAGGSH